MSKANRNDSRIVEGMAFAEYLAVEAISASAIKQGKLSPLHTEQAVASSDDASDTPIMRRGRLIHDAVMFGNVEARYAAWTGAVCRGAAYEEFCTATEQAGKTAVSQSDYAAMIGAAIRVYDDADAGPIMRACKRFEVSLFWTTKKYGPAKARLDGLMPDNTRIEVKTSGDISPHAFERTCYNMGYHLQLGWYDEAARKCGIKSKHTLVIAIEQNPPYDVRVYRPIAMLTDHGRKEAIKIAAAWWKCRAHGVYRGQSRGIELLKLPGWAVSGEASMATGTMEASEL